MRRNLALALAVCLATGCSKAPSPSATPEVSGTPTPLANAPDASDDFVPEEGFTRLTLADFEPFQGDAGTWHEEGGEIICSGIPKGYMHTRESYGNFVWRAEYRYAPKEGATPEELEKSNTGFMIHIQQPHKVWPRSLEVQGRYDEICSIKSNGGASALTIHDDPAARASARKPVGEWNSVEIVSQGGALTAYLNGRKVCESEPGELSSGQLGLQSELFEVHFRRMRIRSDQP